MKIFSDINSLPAFKKAVVTIGTFDGVHRGHQQIISQLKEEAARAGGETVLITFDPHPRKVVSDKPLRLINTLEEKMQLLSDAGIDNLVVVPFNAAFAEQPATAYVEDFLIGRFHPHTVIIGYDHRFGQGRSGDFHLLEKYAALHSFRLVEIPVRLVDEAAISSTRIREALLNGRPEEAAKLLGYDYFFGGTVVTGNRLGRTIGYPTANLELLHPDKLVPADGVYAVRLSLGKGSDTEWFGGMMNIGMRPTVNGKARTMEVNIFAFDRDIYGRELQVHCHRYLRGEQKFDGLDALKTQLATDRVLALEALVKI